MTLLTHFPPIESGPHRGRSPEQVIGEFLEGYAITGAPPASVVTRLIYEFDQDIRPGECPVTTLDAAGHRRTDLARVGLRTIGHTGETITSDTVRAFCHRQFRRSDAEFREAFAGTDWGALTQQFIRDLARDSGSLAALGENPMGYLIDGWLIMPRPDYGWGQSWWM